MNLVEAWSTPQIDFGFSLVQPIGESNWTLNAHKVKKQNNNNINNKNQSLRKILDCFKNESIVLYCVAGPLPAWLFTASLSIPNQQNGS